MCPICGENPIYCYCDPLIKIKIKNAQERNKKLREKEVSATPEAEEEDE